MYHGRGTSQKPNTIWRGGVVFLKTKTIFENERTRVNGEQQRKAQQCVTAARSSPVGRKRVNRWTLAARRALTRRRP